MPRRLPVVWPPESEQAQTSRAQAWRLRALGHGLVLCGLVLGLAQGSVANGGVRITELLADNDGFLHDADADSPDWIELYNDSAIAVNLAGWHLTDDPDQLAKWTFPATNLMPGSYVVVLASGKDRAVAGAELHTNFRLNQAGGWVGLVAPDGTLADAVTYPRQRANVSFGVGISNPPPVTLLAAAASAQWWVPTHGSLGVSWVEPAFDATGWTVATTPLQYQVVTGGVPVLSVDFNDRENDTAANTQTGFSSFVIGSVGSVTAIQTGAVTRTFGNLTVTLSNSAPGIGYDDRFRTSPVNSGAFTLEAIFRDFVFSRELTGTSGLDVFIAGLVPGQAYAGTIWSFDAVSANNRISDWFVNGLLVTNNYTFNGNNLPTDDTAYQIRFQAAADAGGGLLISGRRDAASYANSPAVFINALQLTPLGGTVTNGNLAAMAGRNASVFVRQTFVVTNPTAFNALTLRIRYNDGFVAWLNGVEVARRQAPESLSWDAAATGPHSAAQTEDVPLPGAAALLVPGTNVLALQGLNLSAADADFLLEPQLIATVATEYSARYFVPPTPGAPNGPGYVGLVADTKFSADRGFYDAPLTVAITCATPGAQIWWTTNGSAPTPSNGTLYTAPLLITNTTCLRAAAFLDGYVPSRVDTHTYIFISQVLRQPATLAGYPTTWQANYPADYEMDPNVVNSPTYGPTLSNDLRSIPTLSLVSEHWGLWHSSTGIYPNATQTGDAWERPASAELILPSDQHGLTAFAVTCGLQMHGNASRDNVRTPKHSFRLRFSSDYGPAKLRYDWFPDSPVQAFDNIVLKAGFCDSWPTRYSDTNMIPGGRGTRYRPEDSIYLRDVWMKDAQLAMGWHSARNTFVHLYLNGLYWGLYYAGERIDARHLAQHFGGRPQDWDVLSGDVTYNYAEVKDGNREAWDRLMALVNAGITNQASYQAVEQQVDVDNLIDYMLLHFFAEAEDWPHHNFYCVHRRAGPLGPETRWQFIVWDQEIVFDQLVSRNRVEVNNADTPARIYAQLRAWPEFRVRFGDRAHKHLFNGGALTASNCIARLQARAAEIDRAIVAESARWGDAREFTIGANPGTGQTFTRDEWWVPELHKLYTNWFPRQPGITIERLRAAGLYPALGAPEFSQFGGGVPAGFALAITHTNASGTIFFTLDGSDPRVPGSGAVAPNAQAYEAPIPLHAPTLVRARVRSGLDWSALTEAMFYPPQDLSRLVLTELMYHPPAVGSTNGDEFEFIELKNAGSQPLNLSGLTFTAGISFTFSNGTVLEPGAFLVLVRNPEAFASQYPGVPVGGVYSGKLDNAGERLTLSHPLGQVVWSVAYDDEAPWPVAADGWGFSLVQKSGGATQAPDNGAAWRASTWPGGSPGADDPSPAIPPIVINEVLSASRPPQLDAIELFNPTPVAVDVGGWFLTDDRQVPAKFRIPDGTIIPAGGYVVFDERHFNAVPGAPGCFALSAAGDEVYLFSADAAGRLTGYSHGFGFGAAEPGVTFGRHVNSAGDEQFPAQAVPTLGSANAGPRVGPVVINEVHYHPPPGEDEFVELKNITAAPVALFEPGNPAGPWRLSGLGFEFPSNTVLEAGGLLLIVPTDPEAFRLRYNVPATVPVLGPAAGTLQDSGERLRLERPTPPDTNGSGWIVVDEVRYNDKAPWPAEADGPGPSLQRRLAASYGNDPINWAAAPPTPGRENTFPQPDSDSDGLPDAWEITHDLNPSDPSDASDDPDQDGLTNLAEYQAGTDPHDPRSRLEIAAVQIEAGWVTLRFEAVSNRAYTLLRKDSLAERTWSIAAEVPAAPTNRWVQLTEPLAPASTRFYRLATPGPR